MPILHRTCLAFAVCVAVASMAFAAPPAPGKHGRMTPPPHSISRDTQARVAARLRTGVPAAQKAAAADTLHFVALRVDFPDLAFGASPPADERHDRFYYENQFRYVRQYFDAASKGRTAVQVSVADTVVHAVHPQAVYGDFSQYDSLMVDLATEAVRGADAAVDFSRYDGVLLVHAGPGQESDIAGDSPAQIWSGFLDDGTFREQLSSPGSTVTGIATGDGVEIRNVVILPEWQVQDLTPTNRTRLGSLGVYCHEIGQRLGMLPLFDPSPSPVPDSQGLGNFDLMAYGLWVANGFIPAQPSAFNRLLMGWIDPIQASASGELLLRDLERGAADSVVALVPISQREYFLVSYILEDPDGRIIKDCAGRPTGPRRFFEFEDVNHNCVFDFIDRDGDGALSAPDSIDSYAGAEWDFFMTDEIGKSVAGTGFGLLILHVDEQALQDALAAGRSVQSDARRKGVDVEEADGIEDLDRVPDNSRAFGSHDDYWLREHEFGPASTPSSASADGAPTGVHIALDGFPDAFGMLPGARARILIEHTPTSASASAPHRVAYRVAAGLQPGAAVAWPQLDGRLHVVSLADSGAIFVLDPAAVDGSVPLPAPRFQLPPAWRGTWIGAPAVGDLDADGLPDLVVAVRSDSQGVARSALFGWRRDGSELRDPDGVPSLNPGLLARFDGTISAPLVSDFERSGHEAVYVWQADGSGSAHLVELGFRTGSGWTQTQGVGLRGRPHGVPIATRLDALQPDVAWAVDDSVGGIQTVAIENSSRAPRFVAVTWTRSALQLASGDLNADGTDDLAIVSEDGWFWARGQLVTWGDLYPSPLALADLDGDATLEILFVGARAVHALSSTGAELHGWPYALAQDPGLQRDAAPGRDAGAPLVADLDGDGTLEILVHLRGGAGLVFARDGTRRPDLEVALPARAAGTPALLDLDNDGRVELLATGRFAATRGYDAGPENLRTEERGELVVVQWPRTGRVDWGQLGGSAGHRFRDDSARSVQVHPNAPGVPSFAVGPNPADDEVRARVELTAPATVRCRLFDLEGQIVRAEERSGGAGAILEFRLDARSLASGTYVLQIEVPAAGRRTTPVVVRH